MSQHVVMVKRRAWGFSDEGSMATQHFSRKIVWDRVASTLIRASALVSIVL